MYITKFGKGGANKNKKNRKCEFTRLGLKNICGFSMCSNQYWAGRVYATVCLIYDGSTRRLTESGFMEKPGTIPDKLKNASVHKHFLSHPLCNTYQKENDQNSADFTSY